MPFAAAIPATIPRAALMTGGVGPLNQAIALALADLGFAVAVQCHETTADTKATASALRQHGVAVLPADPADPNALDRLVPAATALLGPLGLLVNDAGAFPRDQPHDDAQTVWDAPPEPGLRASFVLMQRFAAVLPAAAEAVVCNLSPPAPPAPHLASDAVFQAGLLALTRTMALALAPRIRVNGIAPGRGTEPEDVARALHAMLALPSVTGQMLVLDHRQHLKCGPAVGQPAIEERP